MRVKVIKKFIDKKEGKVREVGEVFDITKKRFEEINSTSFGFLVEEMKEENKNEQDNRHIGEIDE